MFNTDLVRRFISVVYYCTRVQRHRKLIKQKDCSRPVPKLRSKLTSLCSPSSSVTNDLNLILEENEEISRPKPVPRQRNIKIKSILQTKIENQAINVTSISERPELGLSLEDNTSQQTSTLGDTRGMGSEATEHSEQTFGLDKSSNQCFSVEDIDVAIRMNSTLIHHELIQSTAEVTGEQSDTFRECFLPGISSNLNASGSFLEPIRAASNVQDEQIYAESIPKDRQTADIPIPLPTFLQNVSDMSSSNSDSESFHTPNSNEDTFIHQRYIESKKKHDVVLPEKDWDSRSVEQTIKKIDSDDENDFSPERNLIARLLEPKEKQEIPDDDDDHIASYKHNLKSGFMERKPPTKDDNDVDYNDDDDDKGDDDLKKNHAENIQIGNKNVQLICQRMSQSATRNIQIGSRNVMINLRFQKLGSYKLEEKEENIFHLEQDKEVVYIKIKRFERKYTKTISESEYDKLPIPGRRKSRSTSKAIRSKRNPHLEIDRENLGSRSCNRIIEEIRFTAVDPLGHDDEHNISEAETINRIIEEDGVLYECIDKEVDVQTVTPPNNAIKDLNDACMNGDIDSIFETLCSVENISCFIQQGGDNFDVELIGNEENEDIYHEAVDIDDYIDDDYDMPGNWTLTTHIHQKQDKQQRILDMALHHYNQDSLYSTVETLKNKVWCKGSNPTFGGNRSYRLSFPKTEDLVKTISEDPDYDCPDRLSIRSVEACDKDCYALPVKKGMKPSTSNSSTSSGCLYKESMSSTENLGISDGRPNNTAKNSFFRANALPRGYLMTTEEYNCDEGQGSYCRSVSPSLKYQTPIPPPRPPDISGEVRLEQSRVSPLLPTRPSPLGREFSSGAKSPPLPQRNLPPNLRSKGDRPMQPLPQKVPVKRLQAKDCATERTKFSLEFNTSAKLSSKGNGFGDMSQSPRRLFSEGHERKLSDSDDDAPPIPPRPRACKALSEKNQSPGPLQTSEIPKISSPVIPIRGGARKDAYLGQNGPNHGNVIPLNAPVNKIYADGSKSASRTSPGNAKYNDLNPPAFSSNRNPQYPENKFEKTSNRLENLNDCGKARKRSENIYTEDPFRPSCHMKKEAVSERSSNSSYVIPNPTNHSTERTRMIRNKPVEASCDDRSVQEIASSRLWYHGNLDRCVAKQMLVNLSINGSFLVRDASSPNQPNHVYTLETYYVGSVYKFQISKEKGEFFFNGFPNRAFHTLDAMVEAMMTYGMEVQDESEEWIHINLTLPWRVCMEKKAEK
ncbi:hypothetical protein CHS0354_006366 [Potamilus streckersoni]|uniref:SH2 domain-containing protein n=1 Tax=Potamilus streckersoni TaxID=2493646 RepID=A0AAE0SVG9_9BIVA|nr:hypothetical protein CHS0354_006366 [Potamilus streckersoni]